MKPTDRLQLPQGRPGTTHNSARCPWCGGVVLRDDRVIDGYLRRAVACLRQDSCGWMVVLDGVSAREKSK